MSSTTKTQDCKVQEKTSAATAPPRKRRRRATATGAAEDCFTCRKRQTQCDRRRPYCTQCIEIGKECTGYRTTLTWGVGVASRGKLRGQSLPVPKSTSQNATKLTREAPNQTSSSNGALSTRQPGSPQTSTTSMDPPATSASSQSKNQLSTEESMKTEPTSPISIPNTTPHFGWHLPNFQEHTNSYPPLPPKLNRDYHSGPLQRIHTSFAGSYPMATSYEDPVFSVSAGSMSAYSDSDYHSPSEVPQTPDDFAFTDNVYPMYHGNMLNPSTTMASSEPFSFPHIPRTCPSMSEDMSSSMSSDQSIQDFVEVTSSHHGQYGSNCTETMYDSDMAGTESCMLPETQAHYQQMEMLLADDSTAIDTEGTSLPRSIYPAPIYGLSPRMQYLLDYYDKAICSVLVAFDGPTNPYRMHVMHLAMGNKALQNAIAALAINNIRMRGGLEAKRIGYADATGILPEHAYTSISAKELREMHGKPSPEELNYKQISVNMLNAQLADPKRAKDDSVLATLLVLCLFHVCDSGFSKFRTQLAGVQKLLSLRDSSVQSSFVGWIEMFFTWFDVMTSCVNDRETEIRGDNMDMLDLSANLGALEHLAGCEGRLFKLIARLGRLSLLSQNRPVRQLPGPTPRPSPQPKRARDHYSISYDSLDGNGWSTPMSHDLDSRGSLTPQATSSLDLRHPEFWSEWSEIRSRLKDWELDIAPASPMSPATICNLSSTMLDPSQRDLLHISESFRYSALLYVERLAHPSASSASVNLQNLVSQSLFHISHIGITSCVNKFLLWPLFITGTECVDENHKAIIRQRIVEIQRESGFFNNLSGLEVLEKVWRVNVEEEELSDCGEEAIKIGDQGFKWRKAMDRVDGEYVVV